MAQGTCSIEGCEGTAGEPGSARGWCRRHYRRWQRHGDPLGGGCLHLTFPENLLARMEPQPNGCIHYTGALFHDGYGALSVQGKQVRAHRAAYEHFVGQIPRGMELDHECHNGDATCIGGDSCLHRRCVNVEHLAVKTHRENILASALTTPGINARKTHCTNGHEFTPSNTKVDGRGKRICRQCLHPVGTKLEYIDTDLLFAGLPWRRVPC